MSLPNSPRTPRRTYPISASWARIEGLYPFRPTSPGSGPTSPNTGPPEAFIEARRQSEINPVRVYHGDTGPQGPSGSQGDTGPTGNTGPTGGYRKRKSRKSRKLRKSRKSRKSRK